MCGCQLSCENSKQQKKRSEIKHPLIQVSIDHAVYMMSSLLCFFFFSVLERITAHQQQQHCV